MINAILVVLPAIAYQMDLGCDYVSAIDEIYTNGTADFFARAGRHLASEDPDEATDAVLANFNGRR